MKKQFKYLIIVAIVAIITGVTSVIYIFNKPHRDVQTAKADYTLTGSQIVSEYLNGQEDANQKYLSQDGNSRILKITGIVNKISDNLNGQKVLLLKGLDDKAGVSATFTAETNHNVADIQIGQTVTIKGVIRSGASFDEDLELYENVILDKSDIVEKLETGRQNQ